MSSDSIPSVAINIADLDLTLDNFNRTLECSNIYSNEKLRLFNFRAAEVARLKRKWSAANLSAEMQMELANLNNALVEARALLQALDKLHVSLAIDMAAFNPGAPINSELVNAVKSFYRQATDVTYRFLNKSSIDKTVAGEYSERKFLTQVIESVNDIYCDHTNPTVANNFVNVCAKIPSYQPSWQENLIKPLSEIGMWAVIIASVGLITAVAMSAPFGMICALAAFASGVAITLASLDIGLKVSSDGYIRTQSGLSNNLISVGSALRQHSMYKPPMPVELSIELAQDNRQVALRA